MFIVLSLQATLAFAGPAVPPPFRLGDWADSLTVDVPGTRVAMIVEATSDVPVVIEVGASGVWVVAHSTWQNGRVAVLVADLPMAVTTVRFRSADSRRIVSLDADLFAPGTPEPRRDGAAPPPTPGVLPAELTAIGVISRSSWGADPTTCSSTEDDWYRMAIHHTAGSQTYGGTVQGSVQALQAYAMGTGEYCDIPYQFLVGFDGSLWEGRPFDYYSGATGGGNNDGNAAVCFLGCYHPSGCSTSHAVTQEMMDGGQLLVQTFATIENIASNEDSIRGHRDWPDNATACPGDWLYARLGELREPLGPSYAATLASQSCSPEVDGILALQLGETGVCTIDFVNSGKEAWSPGTTNLAPIPRDQPHALGADSWPGDNRVGTVAASTASGGTGKFTFEVYGAELGEHTLALGLVQEAVTWFADDGGPADGAVSVAVTVVEPAETGRGDDIDTSRENSPVVTAGPGDLVPMSELGAGCGCSTPGGTLMSGGSGGGALLFALATAIRRRRPNVASR